MIHWALPSPSFVIKETLILLLPQNLFIVQCNLLKATWLLLLPFTATLSGWESHPYRGSPQQGAGPSACSRLQGLLHRKIAFNLNSALLSLGRSLYGTVVLKLCTIFSFKTVLLFICENFGFSPRGLEDARMHFLKTK